MIRLIRGVFFIQYYLLKPFCFFIKYFPVYFILTILFCIKNPNLITIKYYGLSTNF